MFSLSPVIDFAELKLEINCQDFYAVVNQFLYYIEDWLPRFYLSTTPKQHTP